MDPSQNRAALEAWAQQIIRNHVQSAGEALAEYCKKPRSAKRLHSARKQLARLRAALDDLAPLAGVSAEFRDRVSQLHKRAGKVRDADVLQERVLGYCKGAHGEERSQLRDIREALCKRRKKARNKLSNVIAQTIPDLRP